MTKVAAELASCGQADALRRSFVLTIAPALCLDASRATQVRNYTHSPQPHEHWIDYSGSATNLACY